MTTIEKRAVDFLEIRPATPSLLGDNYQPLAVFLGINPAEASRLITELETRGEILRWSIVRDGSKLKPDDPVQPPSRWKKRS
jgi:hypothetical protein